MKPNLFKENVLEEARDRNSILNKTQIVLNKYKDYIHKSIQVVQQQGTIEIAVTKLELNSEETAWKVDLDALSEALVKRADYELFNREVRTVYLEPPINSKAKKIKIVDRNGEEGYLIFETNSRNEEIEKIYLKANDYQLRKQLDAVKKLMHSPDKHHNSILQLFNDSDKAARYFEQHINDSIDFSEIDWKVLTNEERDGTDQQRDFVRKALQTNDFALLEGPPGSGKTTAIIELILQLIEEGKRILLVSATHVAVDNVIHRILTSYKNVCQGKVVPLRIGDKRNISKESVKPYRLETFIDKKKRDVKRRLGKVQNRTDSQEKLYNYLKNPLGENTTFNDIILKSANLVGGTMIGVLQHPDIGSALSNEMFDVMIVDESSKVTFLDFIVPALYAKKWILVGDVQQLSPYVEGDYINESIDEVIESKEEKEQIIHQFELRKDIKRSEGQSWGNYLKVILTKEVKNSSFDNLGVVYQMTNNFIPTPEDIFALNSADVVVCMDSKKAKDFLARHVFVKTKIFEGSIELPEFQNRQKFLHQDRKKNKKSLDKYYHRFEITKEQTQEWKELVGSRLGQYYEYRFNEELAKGIKEDLELLVPNGACRDKLDNIRKVALPSILELLQIGIGKRESSNDRVGKQIIYEGFKRYSKVKHLKFQSLKYQHRMNDLIAKTSRVNFYSDNLITANKVRHRKNILESYDSYAAVVWVANDKAARKNYRNQGNKNVNLREIDDIKKELESFFKYAQLNPKVSEGIVEDYEVAVLTFYRQQEYELRKMLRRLTGQGNKNKFFSKGKVKITLCTVDKFQGDEADLVLLSFAIYRKRAFYNNSNRLNVALTRARYKLVLFGDKSWLGSNAMSEALQYLANEFEERISSKNNNNKK